MGPSQDKAPCVMIPSITVSPPTSPREDSFHKHRPSFDLETIDEAESVESCFQKQPKTLLSPAGLLGAPRSSDKLTAPSARNECNGDGEQALTSDDELDKLKSMATRLRLATRRPSYVEWCANLPKLQDLNCNLRQDRHRNEDWKTFLGRRERLDEKIQWVRKELIQMKSQDHRLAIQLMRLRSEIQQLKLLKSCREHRELIDTATECAQEDRDCQQPAMCDPPFRSTDTLFALEKPLKDVGVTRLNLFARRFSLC